MGVLHAVTQGSKLPPAPAVLRGTETGAWHTYLPHCILAVVLSTDARILLARFSLLGLTWRGAWGLWRGAGRMVMGNIASATLAFGGMCVGKC